MGDVRMGDMDPHPALLRMINSQADTIERMAQTDLSGPAQRPAGARRLLLVGTGTRQPPAALGAPMRARAGLDARPARQAHSPPRATPPRPSTPAPPPAPPRPHT